MLTSKIRVWWIQKSGYAASEYEDAYRIADPTSDGPLRIAVADGATGATFSGPWASLLCEDYISGRLTKETLSQRTPLLTAQWQHHVEMQNLPWYAQEKVSREGSHAALLGLTVDLATGRYQALSVGDVVLIHLRPKGPDTDDKRVVTGFPFSNWENFGTAPVLIGTQPVAQQNLSAYIAVEQGNIIKGDQVLLMTDAIAAWFLREYDKGRSPWRWLEPLDRRDGDRVLTGMVQELRDSHRLKDDDVTIVSLHVTERTTAEE